MTWADPDFLVQLGVKRIQANETQLDLEHSYRSLRLYTTGLDRQLRSVEMEAAFGIGLVGLVGASLWQ